MSKEGSSKIVFITLVLMILVTALGNQVFGATGGKPAIQQLQIQSVKVDFSDGSIHIYGQNFVNGATPVVTIGGTNLSVKSYVSGEIEAELPASTAAGDYLLIVSTGSATAQNDKYDLTIGVPGLMGVNCAVGQVLVQTASGWVCRSLAVFPSAIGLCTGTTCDLTCNPGYGDCDGNYKNGCEANLLNDNSHCGNCYTYCHDLQECLNGACTCQFGWTNCNGECRALWEDPNNCGSCGRVCPSQEYCSDGACHSCGQGSNFCNGQCVDFLTDSMNCGACGHVCPLDRVCSSGVCSCPAEQTDCNGLCTALRSDPTNCGACGHVCPLDRVCSSGVCVLSCPPEQMDCNGLCKDLSSDPANCGACGNVCPDFWSCINARCSQLAIGTTCTDAAQCQSGFCVDDFCSDSSCTGVCMSTASYATGMPDGFCQPILLGLDPYNECGGRGCNGSGGCNLL